MVLWHYHCIYHYFNHCQTPRRTQCNARMAVEGVDTWTTDLSANESSVQEEMAAAPQFMSNRINRHPSSPWSEPVNTSFGHDRARDLQVQMRQTDHVSVEHALCASGCIKWMNYIPQIAVADLFLGLSSSSQRKLQWSPTQKQTTEFRDFVCQGHCSDKCRGLGDSDFRLFLEVASKSFGTVEPLRAVRRLPGIT